MRIVFLSDTHGHEPVVPDGDLLIHSGDLTGRGTVAQVRAAAKWLGSLPHPAKVAIAGNHDWSLYREDERKVAEAAVEDAGVHYLRDSYVRTAGVSILGSPWTPEFCGWAFMESEAALGERYAKFQAGFDILVTHGPPLGIMDKSSDGHPCGSTHLLRLAARLKPAIHAFGHIHEGYGTEQRGPTLFVNAAICTLAYQPTNAPIVVEFDPETRRGWKTDVPMPRVIAPTKASPA